MQCNESVTAYRNRFRVAAITALAVVALPFASIAEAAESAAALEQQTVAEVAPAALPAPPQTAMERIRSTGRIRLGYLAGARPFSFADESGKPAGYAIELCQRVADAVGAELPTSSLQIEWIAQTLEGQDADVRDGRVDVACSAGRVTLSRRSAIAFSIPVFPGSIGALLRRDAPWALRDLLEEGEPRFRPFWRAAPAQILEQQTYAVIPGSAGATWLDRRASALKVPARVEPVDGLDAGVQKVLDGKADVFFADRAMLLDAARRHSNERALLVLDRKFTFEPVALGLPRADEDLRLLVDRTLSRLSRSGELLTLYEGSFGEADDSTKDFFRTSALPE